MRHGQRTIDAQVRDRTYRQQLQAEMGSDWTEGREMAHREADAEAFKSMLPARIKARVSIHQPNTGD